MVCKEFTRCYSSIPGADWEPAGFTSFLTLEEPRYLPSCPQPTPPNLSGQLTTPPCLGSFSLELAVAATSVCRLQSSGQSNAQNSAESPRRIPQTHGVPRSRTTRSSNITLPLFILFSSEGLAPRTPFLEPLYPFVDPHRHAPPATAAPELASAEALHSQCGERGAPCDKGKNCF